jgi:signal transduction histidine kinase
MLEIVDRNTWRLKALIEDLLTLSRIEAGALKVNPQPLVVADLVEAAAATLRPTLSGSDLVFDVDPGPRDACVHGDQGQLERVLLNLLSNAVKFSPDGGRVGLRAETTGDAVTITVSDTGIGIPEREQQQLFNRFFRASNATSRAIQGTGLGLSIVRSIVERHGGTLAVRSAVGQGTTVQVRLPQLSRADPPTPAAGQPGRSGDPPTLEPAVPSSGTLS